jgi:hypothetical protein
VDEVLCDPDGSLSERTLAQRLVRQLESEAQAQPAARLVGRCAPGVALIAQPLVRRLCERFGARLSVEALPAAGRDRLEVGRS